MVDANFLSNLYLTVGINIASNGLTSLIAHASQELKELLARKENSEQTEEIPLQTLLEYAINDLDERITLTPARGREILSSFLHASEVEEIVRQIYSTNLKDNEVSSNLETIRSLFVTLLTRYFAAYPSEVTLTKQQLQAIANPLFDAILKGCETTLDGAIDKGIIAAHEAKEVFRFNILQSQIASIQKELEFLPTANKLDITAILKFEKQYRERVGQRHGRIIPPNLNSAQPQPIDALYVYPKFTQVKNQTKLEFNKDDVFSSSFRSVVLGNPGGGKSTLAQKLCHDLANNYSRRIFAGRKALTPILVILRNYGSEKKERKCSILDFIETEVKSTYQLEGSPYNTFQYLLHTGRAMVIFDGLDELLDTSHRQEIRDDVELFCSSYPSVPVLVTSREVGYEQAPLDKSKFQVFYLDEFDEEAVKDYVTKWFNLANFTEAEKQRQAMAEAFLKDSQIVQDLRSNPLMLALLCTIYREEHYIPRYRPDVYEKCAVMLFERWDKSRNIYSPPLPEEHIRPLMEYLAYWIYGDELLRAGVTEDELVNKTAAYLHEWIYENVYKAERTAQEFIKFCVGRAWVFTDTGTEKQGERLYQFVHPTFLEYFTASYYVRSSRTPKELLRILKPRIAKREWDVMAQLAFQLQHKKNVGAGDELLKNLVEESRKNRGERGWNILSFTVRCLKFIVPRPEVRRLITEAFLERSLTLELAIDKDKTRKLATDVLDNLFDSVSENLTTIIDTFTNSISDLINSDKNEDEHIIGYELMFYLSWFIRNREMMKIIQENLLEKYFQKLIELCPKYFSLGYFMLWSRKIDLFEFIRLYGIKSLSLRGNYKFFRSLTNSLIDILSIYVLIGPNQYRKEIDSVAIIFLSDLGRILPSYSTPWFTLPNLRAIPTSLIKLIPITNKIDINALFGIFICFAVLIEMYLLDSSEDKNNKDQNEEDFLFVSIHDMGEYLFKMLPELITREEYLFYSIFVNRISNINENKEEIIKKYKFSEEQEMIVKSWMNNQINLIDYNLEN